ncbi:cathepsin O-like [Leptopilina heterotoma]|uniref:cathepsin O-like n=1 Tax=Leptopilina heterotoma TaxID=63436 RepID=UPI001CA93345|nr:cathepsin O-like [Leptopilina heterotoma]
MQWKTVVLTILIVSLCFFAVPIRIGPNTSDQELKLFKSYVVRFNKSYRHNPDEYDKRFYRFQKSLRHINKMNDLRTSVNSAYYGLTQFSDLSEEEFMKLHLRPDISVRSAKHVISPHYHSHRSDESISQSRVTQRLKRALNNEIPIKFDWRMKNLITPVKAQGSCGACWAFSTIEVAETMFALKNGTLHSFSVQEMIDCAENGNFGCDGGDICSLLSWLIKKKVEIFPEVSYPLTRRTEQCKFNKTVSKNEGIKISEFTCDNFVGAEEELLNSIATHGPVAAAVNALSWQNYLGGVIQFHCDGAFSNLNHAVQIVGYDNSAPTPYYIVRNSWSTFFGDMGYLYIAIGNNMCGIANQVSSIDVI